MSDIIQLLPDSLANQIAAGEVIQRPSSVVKELVENSVDAGSTSIKVIIRDAGKNLIQVVDNGKGMSETDAKLSFERHATSKIKAADDLFNIKTMGFRGEALASIAAVSETEMQTKRDHDQVGTTIEIKGGRFIKQESVACQPGCTISVKNLFFNVPARRKFLKKNSTELRHIIGEFQRVALAYPEIEFSLYNNETELYRLARDNQRKRLIAVFGKNINQHIIEISTPTNIVSLTGYVGKPECAKKNPGEQFFFVNRRFMRHPYFHKAVTNAFEKIVPENAIPSYFIYLAVDPATVDVNIHPTKTEIKFENELDIWKIIHASVREALGKFNIVPSIDFNTEGMIDIPPATSKKNPALPQIEVDPGYNPFDNKTPYHRENSSRQVKNRFGKWEEIYKEFESDKNSAYGDESGNTLLENGTTTSYKEFTGKNPNLLQIKNRYILSPVKSGLMIIDQKRAHERILYEKLIKAIRSGKVVAQQQLYPVTVQLSRSDYIIIRELGEELADFGFDIRDFGHNSILISGCPADMVHTDPATAVENLIAEYKSTEADLQESRREKISRNLARSSAIGYGKSLTREEMQELIDRLFACELPNYSPDKKPVISIISNDEIGRRLDTP